MILRLWKTYRPPVNCKKIIEMLNETFRFKSEERNCVRFYFTIAGKLYVFCNATHKSRKFNNQTNA